MPHAPLGIGIVGLGFMGATHFRAYAAAARAGLPCRMVAVSDPDPLKLTGQIPAAGNMGSNTPEQLFAHGSLHTYRTPQELFNDPDVHVVSICTYTDTHVELALAALAARKHVLLEKPIALNVPDIKKLDAAAKAAGRLCMPAMCMRFWPGWDIIKTHIEKQTFGPVKSAVFTRLGSGPSWAHSFYRDESRSGGALFDLHIHDTDFIYWCFGMPLTVTSNGSVNHVVTDYVIANQMRISAEGGWSLQPGDAFQMRYRIEFERAVIDFDIAKSPCVTITQDGISQCATFPSLSGYDVEVRHFIHCIIGDQKPRATLADAAEVVAILQAEKESLTQQKTIPLM